MPSVDNRNLVLVGHNASGKTLLSEALLAKAGAIKRRGSIAEKSTVSDYDPDEKERGNSLDASCLNLTHKDRRINLIDTPGMPDFIAGVMEGLAAVECALLTVNAATGIEVMTRKIWGLIEARSLPRMIVVTKMDHERAKFDDTVKQLREIFGASVTPLFLPIGEGAGFKGVVNLLTGAASAPAEVADRAKDLSAKLIESIVSADDALMERYLGDEKISPEEIAGCFAKGLVSGVLTPVLCVSAEKDVGVAEVLDALAELTPGPTTVVRKLSRKVKDEVETRELEQKPDGPLYALVFKSKRDPFVGKIAYLRIFSGTLNAGAQAKSSSAARPDKFAHFLAVQGKETKEVEVASVGDIIAVARNENLNCGDTVSTEEGWLLDAPTFPTPMFAVAVSAKNRNDEAKISGQLRALAEGDPTFQVEVDPETKELVIRGIGNVHMDLMLTRLKRSGIEVNTRPPKIPYRSTINGRAEVRYRHKKQSGGAGQFGEVQILVEPNPGKGYEFVDEIVGGVIPNNLIPSVDKGIQKKLAEGVWPGILVVDVLVRLNDGKSHPVDSKDIAFQIAGRSAFREAFLKAKPALIEPIVNLEVVTPAKYMGDITGHLSGRRGRISGMDQLGDMQVVKAQIPLSEVQNYSGDLKSMTGGEGFYTMEFSHYDTVPAGTAQPIIAAAMSRQVAEEE